MNTKVIGVILAGGQSKRMGQDKALVCLKGKTLLAHMYERLKILSPPLRAVALSSGVWQAQAKTEALEDDVLVIPDLYPNLGPLGGIYSVIKGGLEGILNEVEYLLVVPVDMPLMTAEALSHLIVNGMSLQEYDAFTYKNKPFPLLIRTTEKVLSRLETVMNEAHPGTKTPSVQQFLNALSVYKVDPPGLEEHIFANANTPAELRQIAASMV